MMAVGIRLIQRNGKVINLDAEKIGFSVGRAVAAIPIPVLGERFGADLNAVATEVSISGIARDDDCTSSTVTPSKASGFIDFSRPNVRDANVQASIYFTEDGGEVTIESILDKPFYLRSTHQQGLGGGEKVTFKFVDTAAGHTYIGGIVSIDLDLTANTYGSIILGGATSRASWLASVFSLVLNDVANPIGIATTISSQHLGDAFSATTVNGMNTTLGAARVDIYQIGTGANGNSGTPTFWNTLSDSSTSTNQLAVKAPAFLTFRGGNANNCRSAGDKIQDLIANVANSNVMGAVGEMFQMVSNDDKQSAIKTDFNKLDPTAGASDDYIVGIQIPYNSIVQASGDAGNMVARNFILVTGLSPADHQGSLANINPAGVNFSSTDVYTGIRGTVSAFGFDYSAGDTFYPFKLTFKPIDFIVGL
jgi:hypothetical protein